jgi:hypothetical protein
VLPPEFELTLNEKNEIEKGIIGKKFPKAEDASICDSDGQIHIKFPAHVNHRNSYTKLLHGTYEQIVQYLIDMYPPLEPDCPRIHKGNRGHGWSDSAVDLYVDRKPSYPGKDVNRIAALLKKHKKVFVEDAGTFQAVRAMFPFVGCMGQLLIYEKQSKTRKPNSRRANRVKQGLVGWWDTRLLYDAYIGMLNKKLHCVAEVHVWRYPRTVESYAERAMKLDAFCNRSGVKLSKYNRQRLASIKPYIPGLLKRPEPFWRKFGRWAKKRIEA